MLAIVALCFVPARRADERPAAPVARDRFVVYTPAEGIGRIVAGFGDIWLEDRARGRLLHVDGGGRVRGALPVGGRVAIAATRHDIWALAAGGGSDAELDGPLLRIDPRTMRVRGRTALPRAVIGFGLVPGASDVWLWGPRDILRVDRSGAIRRRIRVGFDRGELTGITVAGRRLFAATADGHLLRFDARTGTPLGVAPVPVRPPSVRGMAAGRVLLASAGEVVAVDPRTGRQAWARRLGFRAGMVARRDGLLWFHSAAAHDPGDRLSGLDPRSGRVVTSGVLPGFGSTGIAVQGGRLWMATAGGRVLVVAPFGT